MGIFDLTSQLAFYASYHTNKTNQLVHIIFVPVLLWSAFLYFAQLSGPLSFLPHSANYLTEMNAGFVLAVFYGTYYILLERKFAGVSMAGIVMGMWILLNYVKYHYATSVGSIVLICQIVGWVSQIAAHRIAEGNSPALLDNLFQSVVLAPLFVWLEVLFSFANYRPDLHTKVKSMAGKRIVERKMKLKKSS